MNRNIKVLVGVMALFGLVYISPNFLGLVIYKQRSLSMEPTLSQGSYVVVNYWAYRSSSPKRYDIVAYESNDGLKRIGRIIALQGEKIKVVNNTSYIDGIKQKELFRATSARDLEARKVEVVLVENSHFYIMGDNRNASVDSRFTGTVSVDNIIGKMVKKI